MVCATSSCLPHFLLKATMLYTYALMSSSIFFYYILGLWYHIMWHVMWLQCHMPSSSFKRLIFGLNIPFRNLFLINNLVEFNLELGLINWISYNLENIFTTEPETSTEEPADKMTFETAEEWQWVPYHVF